MPCDPIINNGKAVGFICSRGRGKPKVQPCYKCGKPPTKLCDFRDYGTRTTTDEYGRKQTHEYAAIGTCDKPMCDECANHTGEDTDYCDEHYNQIAMYRTEQGDRVYKEQLQRLGITGEEEKE